jgi:ABC-type polysaccharide/polyol phosphate export permease
MTESNSSQRRQSQSLVIPTSVGRLHPILAIRDLRQATANWHLWGMLGWQDIRQRYRRSTLGPFWLTLSMGIMVGSIGVIYAVLLKQQLRDYIPYVALGFILWGFISGIMIDGAQAFMAGDAIIKQTRLPLSIHVFRVVWRQVIVFFHNFVIYIAVVLIFGLWPTWRLIWVVPALALWGLNAFWLAFVLGMICARFRDIPPIVNSIIQLGFLVTPIIWKAELMSQRPILVDANPLHHFMEILRLPLLGESPPVLSWYVALGITAAGWLVTFELFRRYRWRIAYWL